MLPGKSGQPVNSLLPGHRSLAHTESGNRELVLSVLRFKGSDRESSLRNMKERRPHFDNIPIESVLVSVLFRTFRIDKIRLIYTSADGDVVM